MGHALLAASSLFFTQMVLLAVAIFVAVFARKIRSVSGIATAIGFGGFLLSALNSLLEEEKFRYVTPFKYFDVEKAFLMGSFDTPYAVTGAVVIVLLLSAAYLRYTKSDIPAL
ncbi:MAG: hypothetical protein VB091_07215 [Christensenella sp.]|nr:hypothetical protein [Christensenella sp.]